MKPVFYERPPHTPTRRRAHLAVEFLEELRVPDKDAAEEICRMLRPNARLRCGLQVKQEAPLRSYYD